MDLGRDPKLDISFREKRYACGARLFIKYRLSPISTPDLRRIVSAMRKFLPLLYFLVAITARAEVTSSIDWPSLIHGCSSITFSPPAHLTCKVTGSFVFAVITGDFPSSRRAAQFKSSSPVRPKG